MKGDYAMNTTLSLIKNANNLDIDIPKLLTYMSIVLKNSNLDPDKVIEVFSLLLDRINKIWGNDDSDDWNNIKSISSKYEISLTDEDGNLKSFRTILANLLHMYNSLSTFCKSEFITALAGESKRNILLTLVENYRVDADGNAVEAVAAAMLGSVYNNQNGGLNNG